MMRKCFLIVFYVMLSLCSIAQSAKVKDVRLTYLWDVTLSMQGKVKGCPNIWDKVKKAMCDDIDQINDESVEIVVIPFQHIALDEWREMATPTGKSILKSKINNYKIPRFDFGEKKNTTMTVFYDPLQYVVDKVLSPDKVDILKMMTDGENEDKLAEYENLLKEWCTIAKQKDAFGFYIMLTEEAKKGLTVLQQVNPCRFETVDVSEMQGSSVSILTLTPQSNYAFNIRDDYGKKITLKFSKNGTGPLPVGYKIHVFSSQNSYIQFDEVVELQSDCSVSFSAKYLMSQETMITSFSEGQTEEIFFHAESAEGMDLMPYAMTRVLDQDTKCEMIYKPEKTVKFHVL